MCYAHARARACLVWHADMVAAGLVRYDDDGFRSVLGPEEVDALHAVRALSFAKAMLRAAQTITLPTTGQPLQMRVGLHRQVNALVVHHRQ